jgi:GAF domain-containing protein
MVDDPAADPAERSLLADLGYQALLMVPIVAGGKSVGLLEVMRRTNRPWTSAEIDQARILAQSLVAAVSLSHSTGEGAAADALPWSPDALGGERAERPL